MARHHLLVVPTVHIDTLHDLHTAEDIELVEHMCRKGREALAILGVDSEEGVDLSFHVPPFNSISHLHLHVFKRPYKGMHAEHVVYSQRMPWCQSAAATIADLRARAGH